MERAETRKDMMAMPSDFSLLFRQTLKALFRKMCQACVCESEVFEKNMMKRHSQIRKKKKKTTLAHKVLEFGKLFYPFTKLQFIPTSCYLLQYVVYVSYDKGDHNTPLPLKHTAIERLKMTVSSHGMGAHTFNLTIWETEADNLCEFNVTLDYKRLNKSKRETEPTDGCAHL